MCERVVHIVTIRVLGPNIPQAQTIAKPWTGFAPNLPPATEIQLLVERLRASARRRRKKTRVHTGPDSA